MPDVIGPVRPKVAGAFKVVGVGDLGGVFVKSVTADGLVTYQDSSDAEQTTQLSTASGGGSFSAGTADPAGGAAGDAYLQVSASAVLQSVWLNESGTWTEYALPPAGGALSDTVPESVTAAANNAGTSAEAARQDHHHRVATASTTEAGISERATDAETRTGTSTSRVVTPANLTAGLDNRASDDNPLPPASTAAAGSSTDFSRSDHVHEEEDLYRGAWSSADAPYKATQVVIHQTITWISLTDNNSEIPNAASLRWAGLPQGYLYRGVAPTSTTKYHYGHTVFVPPSQAYYICTFTAGGQGIDVARARHTGACELPGGHSSYERC